MTPPTTPAPMNPSRGGPAWWKIVGGVCGCITLLAVLGAIGMFVMFREVLKRTPLTAQQLVYAGSWEGQDGTTMSIRGDGSGDFRSGGTKVTGGWVKIDEAARTLEIGLGPLQKKWHIDEPPHPDGGSSEMKLDGMTFRRTGGFGGSSPGPAGAATVGGASGQVPSEIQLRSLTTDTLLEVNQAMQTGDFSAFHGKCAKALREKTSAEKMQEAFQQLIDQHADLAGVKDVAPVLEKPAFLDRDGDLNLKGYYPTKPARTHFDLIYRQEEGAWRPINVSVKVKPESESDE
jgi:hypothetical protein